MKYMRLGPRQRDELLQSLRTFPEFVRECFAVLSPEAGRSRGPGGGFSPVEHCWHLADLEREGFGRRIARLRDEVMPHLPDFDGDRLARERQYLARPIPEGIEAFRLARATNLAMLAELTDAEWRRAGTQEGVGGVSLCDLPDLMAQHDSAHRREIEAWLASGNPTGAPVPNRGA